jgi:hypothetical protein
MFHLGQQVECIDDRRGTMWSRQWLRRGQVYTVHAVVTGWCSGEPAFELEELLYKNAGSPVLMHFRARRFRPLTKETNEASFTIGADPKSSKFDNRRERQRELV